MNKIINYFNSAIVLLFIFSFFNDNFLVEKLNENFLKIIFISFLILNLKTILQNLKKIKLNQDKIFLLYFSLLFIVFLVQTLIEPSQSIIKHTFSFISIFTIILFFSFYNLQKTIFFIWISILFSIILSYFNDPISAYTFRTTGGTGDPNEFAAHTLIFIFTSIYIYTKYKYRLFLLFSILFFLYGIFIAGSKSSFLALFIMLLIIFLLKIKIVLNAKTIIFAFISILITLNFVDFNKINAINNILERSKTSGTAEERYKSWRAGANMVLNNPFLGVGFGDYTKYTIEYSDEYITESSTAPHNLYIKLIAENGIFIFIIFIFFIIYISKDFLKYKDNSIWIYFSFFSLLLMGLSIGITYDKYFLLIIAIVMNQNRLKKANT